MKRVNGHIVAAAAYPVLERVACGPRRLFDLMYLTSE
jgi:hypothetical protein